MKRAKPKATASRSRGVFITATDTGVGKTLVASALVTCLIQRGIDVGVMKPIETGVSRATKARSDGVRLRRTAGSHDPMAEVCPYVFRLPAAPLSAARAEKTTVQIAAIMRVFRALSQKHAFMMVEGIGGVQVPITQLLNVSDIIYRMKLSAIVVGRSGLGGINHALLTLDALRRRKIPIVALVLNQCRPVRTKIARAQEQSTVSLLRMVARVPVIGPLPYSSIVNQNWNEGLVRLAGTAPITKLAQVVLARIIHEDSLRKRADAKREGHSEAKGLAPPSVAVPVPLLRQGQAPKRRAPVPNSMSRG
jgi:dethiobiotin synthetase